MSGDPGRFFVEGDGREDVFVQAASGRGLTVDALLDVTAPLRTEHGERRQRAFLLDVVGLVGWWLGEPEAPSDSDAIANIKGLEKALQQLQVALVPLDDWHQGGRAMSVALRSVCEGFRSSAGASRTAAPLPDMAQGLSALLERLKPELEALRQTSSYALESPFLLKSSKREAVFWLVENIAYLHELHFGELPPKRSWFADGNGKAGLMYRIGQKVGLDIGRGKVATVIEAIKRGRGLP